MSFNDSLSDMLTRIRNAHKVNKSVTYCFSSNLNNNVLKVLKDETIENVAEIILTQEKSVAVIDANNKVVGSINPTKIINTVFGGRKKNN